MSNLKVNRDGTYDFHFTGADLPTVVRLVKQNEIWRKEEAEEEAGKIAAKVAEAEEVLNSDEPPIPTSSSKDIK